MPEIKTRQHPGKPILNTAQQQMQRSFVRTRQKQALHRQAEQSDSPSNYAEERITRTAEDAVRDAGMLAKHEFHSIRDRSHVEETCGYDSFSESSVPADGEDVPSPHQTPANTCRSESYSGNPGVRHQVAEAANQAHTSRQVFQEHPELRSRLAQNTNMIRTKSTQEMGCDTVESAASSARQASARKAGIQNIIKQKQTKLSGADNPLPLPDMHLRVDARPMRTKEQEMAKTQAGYDFSSTRYNAARKAAAQSITRQARDRNREELRFERAHYSQQMEQSQLGSSDLHTPESARKNTASPRTSSKVVTAATQTLSAENGALPCARNPISLKTKSDFPIRAKREPMSIKDPKITNGKVIDATAEHAFQEARKATIKAVQKSNRAAEAAGHMAVIAAKKAREAAAKLARSAAEAAKALYMVIAAGGAAAVLVIVVVVLIGCGAVLFGSQDGDSTETLPLSAEVEAYEPVIREYAKQYGIPDYVLLIQAVMMQESGGRGNDPMQASECNYNTQYPRIPGGITDPEYSIAVGIQNLADCLRIAEVESPIDLDHIQLALQGYNFGSGYITWALQKYGEYTRANAVEFSMKMAEQMGWNSYGDKQYVPHVLRYYPIGKVFYTPEGGDAIVDVALSQVGNVGGEPYWSWYGFTNHVEWCACFISWCADQCGYLDSGAYPKFSGCVMGMQWFQQRGLWLDRSTEPAPGMLIFFDWSPQNGVPDHVGIVERVENGMVYTVEGNSRDVCRQKQYSLGSSVILGYGMPSQ